MRRRIPNSETLVREYLANERTLLAWIRTGTSSVALGILLDTVARTLNALEVLPPELQESRIVVFSLALVIFGAVVNVVTTVGFMRFRSDIQQGFLTSSAELTLLVVFCLLFLSVAYVVYLSVS